MEDQGYNGNRWNDEATRLLEKLKWTTVGDSNMDITNDSGKQHGVDRILTYQDLKKGDKTVGVLLESKTYTTSSFTSNLLETWIRGVDTKLTNFKNSTRFYEQFPGMEHIHTNTGVIMVWFHDFLNYQQIAEKFWDSAMKVSIPKNIT